MIQALGWGLQNSRWGTVWSSRSHGALDNTDPWPANLKTLAVTEVSSGRWMNKQAVVYPGNGILLGPKMKWFTKPGKDMGRPYMHITQWKKANVERVHAIWFQLYNTVEMGKLWSPWKDPWLPGVKGGAGSIGRAQRIFKGVKILSDGILWIHLSKP